MIPRASSPLYETRLSSTMIHVSTSTHFALSDLVLNQAQAHLHEEIRESRTQEESRPYDIPEVNELRDFHISTLEQASNDLLFDQAFFSIRLVSNMSSHDKEPFVHVWTSLSGQGIGLMELALKEKQLFDEKDVEKTLQRHEDPTIEISSTTENDKKVSRHLEVESFLNDTENKLRHIRDGTVQVPLGGFTKEADTLVSDFSHFTLFFPSTKEGEETGQFNFEREYPADAKIHFQIHSNTGNGDGKMAYSLTGTGSISVAQIAAKVKQFFQQNPDIARRAGASSEVQMDEEINMEPIEIPLVLNAISSQQPNATLVSDIASSRAKKGDLAAKNEALYEGSIFLYVQIADKVTRDLFQSKVAFGRVTSDDVTMGNFSHIASTMKMHVLRDMSPFIEEFTKHMAIVDELDVSGNVVGQRGWTFDPSLPEGKNIHAPFNKVNTHTLPGFTYYHDRAMQRIPNASFILNVARIVFARRGMSEEDFVKHANTPVLVLDSEDIAPRIGKQSLVINPEFVKVIRVVAEIATAYPTSMTYRGDYADMNTDAVNNFEALIADVDTFHHAQHASGMTRRASGHHPSRYSGQRWEESLKIGTEMFGDATMDKSGDCEDFAKLISRMLSGMYSAKSKHPTILAIQSVLHRYIPFSNLSSVTSASVGTAPPEEDETKSSGSHVKHIGGVVIGSRKDLSASIGAHMFSSLLNKQDILKGIQRTSSRIEYLPDGSRLSEHEELEISQNVLHKPMWYVSESEPNTIIELKGKTSIGTHMPRSRAKAHDLSVRMEQYVRTWSPPLILEGTGQANALVNAVTSYYDRLQDKVHEINGTLNHVEAITRLISGLPSEQVTAESIQQNRVVFSKFTMPIDVKRLVDTSPDVRISTFYRMITEMYGIPAGNTDDRVTPPELVRSQLLYNKTIHISRAKSREPGHLFVHGLDMESMPSEDDSVYATYGSGRTDAKDSIYGIDRVFPVQLSQRILFNDEPRHEKRRSLPGGESKYLTFGVNLTDFVHSSTNNGIIRAVKTLPNEARVISNVMRHTAPSPFVRLAPRAEITKARRLAHQYQRILNADIERTLNRGFFGHLVSINMFTRTDFVEKSHIAQLATLLADNGYARAVRVSAESFARGHHLLRITIDMDVSGGKELSLDSNTLSERMAMSREKMDEFLRTKLQSLLE